MKNPHIYWFLVCDFLKAYEKSLEISSYKSIEGGSDIDLNAEVGSTFSVTETSSVTIIDPYDNYIETLKECFDFNGLKEFVKRDEFSLLFDGMHGAGGPFARKVLVEELGLPEVRLYK